MKVLPTSYKYQMVRWKKPHIIEKKFRTVIQTIKIMLGDNFAK